jgi:hypothetical protein
LFFHEVILFIEKVITGKQFTCGDMKEELKVGAAICKLKYSTWTLGVDIHCDVVPEGAKKHVSQYHVHYQDGRHLQVWYFSGMESKIAMDLDRTHRILSKKCQF